MAKQYHFHIKLSYIKLLMIPPNHRKKINDEFSKFQLNSQSLLMYLLLKNFKFKKRYSLQTQMD